MHSRISSRLGNGRAVRRLAGALLGSALVLLAACTTPTPPPPTPTATAMPSPTPTATATPTVLTPEEAALEQAAQVLAALKAQDMAQVAALAHPVQGVRFTPYAYVTDADQVFTPEQVSGLFDDETVYLWGAYDGTGFPIEATFAEYYEEFVFSHDFTEAEQISVNERLGHGNSLDNSQEYYPGAMVVEYHFPGFDPEFGGMDWASLRLVFLEYEGQWRLVGIIHDQWTI